MIEFKPIEGWERYGVSRDGRVKNLETDYTLKQFDGWGEYKQVFLRGTSRWSPYVHRLVALTFIPNPLGLSQVNHKDGNKHNNCVTNLEWVSPNDNQLHALNTGLKARKYPVELIKKACQLFAEHMTSKEVAAETGISRRILNNLRCRQVYREISQEYKW